MKKNIRIAGVFFCLLSCHLQAQEKEQKKDTSVAHATSVKDSISGKYLMKNDFAINLVPMIQFMTGAYTGGDVQRFSMMYKRLWKNGMRFRFGLMFDKVKTPYFNTRDTTYQIITATDTSQLRKYDKGSLTYIKPRLHIGFEKENGKKKLRRFYGADLVVGFYKSYSTQFYHTYYSNPASANAIWKPSAAPDILIGRQDIKVMFLGFSPFYGLRYKFTDHILLSAQVGFDVLVDIGTKTSENANHDKTTQKISAMNHVNPGLINEIALVIRF